MSNLSPRHAAAITPVAVATEAAIARNGDFMEALVAAGALIAHADGEMAGAERRRLLGLVRSHATLSVFSREQIVDEMAVHEANFRLDPEVAQILAREKLMPIAGQPKLSRLVVNACREIMPADGVLHPAEYRVLGEIRAMLGLADPARSRGASRQ